MSRRPSQSARLRFTSLVAAEGTSRLGDAITAVAIPWFVLQTTGSPGRTGVVVFAGALAIVFALFFGGVAVDRIGYRRMSLVGDAASGSTVAAIALLHQLDALPFGLLVALAFLGTLFDLPAQMGRHNALPDAASAAAIGLERANAAFEGSLSIATLAGPALAGVLIAAVGPANVLWFDVGSFGLSILLVATSFPHVERHEPAHGGPLSAAFFEGWRFLRADRVLLALVIYLGAMNLVIGPVETLFIPVYASEVLDSAIALGLMTAFFAAGGLLGIAIFGAFGHGIPRRWLFAGAFSTLPLAFLALSPGPGIVLTLAVLGALGLGLSLGNLLEYTIYFERVPADIRARVLGIVGGLTWLTVPAGRIGAGFLLEQWSLETTLLVVGLAAFPLPFVVLLVGPLRAEAETANPPAGR